MDRARSEAAAASEQGLERGREVAPGTRAANLAAADVAMRRMGPVNDMATAEGFLATLTGGQVPVTLSGEQLAARLAALQALCSGSAADLVARAHRKVQGLPGIVSLALTIKHASVEQAGVDAGERARFKIRLGVHAIVKAFGFEVKNVQRTETGTVVVDPASMLVSSFELPFLDRLKGEINAATGGK